jgi:hypothetical protein
MSSSNVSTEIVQQRAAIDKVGNRIEADEKDLKMAFENGKTDLAAFLKDSLTALRAEKNKLVDQLGILQAKLTGGGGLCSLFMFILISSAFTQHPHIQFLNVLSSPSAPRSSSACSFYHFIMYPFIIIYLDSHRH